MTALAHTWFMFGRQTRNLARQPIWIFIILIQPLVWLLLYSQLFRRITDLPGFGTESYIQFLAPGIVIMTAFFSATWSGMSMISDIDRGVIERFLATPARRSALVLSQVFRAATQAGIQALIILVIAYGLGARVQGGPVGWVVVLLAGMLVAACFAGFSHGIALLTRREETMIAVSNFIALPLVFLSSILIARDLMPGWMQWAARFNPVQWGVSAAREAVMPDPSWGAAFGYLGLLVGATALGASFATWAFRAYRRTL